MNVSTVPSDLSPNGLMIDFLKGSKVVGISKPIPHFGWIVHSDIKNDIQSAYQILVANNRDMLKQDTGDFWDSNICKSSISINIPYRGKKLQPLTSYFWKVKTWCKSGSESSWSEIMEFSTNQMNGGYITDRYPLQQTPILPISIVKKSNGHYLIDFGKVAFGYLHIKMMVSGSYFRRMNIYFGERGDLKGINKKPGRNIRYYKVKFRIKNGLNDLDIHPPQNIRQMGIPSAIKLPAELGNITPFRYIELEHCPVAPEKTMVQQIAIHYPFDDHAATFESSDLLLNEIWELCKYSIKATSYCGIFVDGDRERTPYEADAYINQLCHYAVDSEYSLARYTHEYLLTHPTWPTEWKHHSIFMAWADYMYTGNTLSLTENYTLLKTKTLEHCARADGLLNTKEMKDLVDWPKGERDEYEFTDINTVVNAFYYRSLLLMAEIARVVGKTAESEEYQKKAASVKERFNLVFFDITRKLYRDGELATHASLHANMMPLAFGMVPDDRKKTVLDFIISKGMACSVYGAQYLLEALYENGRPDEALQLMTSKGLRSWYNMLRVGSTITLEAWDNQFKPNQDWNHAWGAVPGNIIPRYVLGIRILEPGCNKILIQPQPASLKKVSAVVPSIHGPISVSFENNPPYSFELNFIIPVNVSAKVGLPRFNLQSTMLILDGEKMVAQELDEFLFVDEIGSGAHTLVIK